MRRRMRAVDQRVKPGESRWYRATPVNQMAGVALPLVIRQSLWTLADRYTADVDAATARYPGGPIWREVYSASGALASAFSIWKQTPSNPASSLRFRDASSS